MAKKAALLQVESGSRAAFRGSCAAFCGIGTGSRVNGAIANSTAAGNDYYCGPQHLS